ncbi:MAG: hypothetical protein IT559_05300 [Alphaproteobacteria bacterium]|nr:hypothetical protein [Alphaproteobacteria bacterium]
MSETHLPDVHLQEQGAGAVQMPEAAGPAQGTVGKTADALTPPEIAPEPMVEGGPVFKASEYGSVLFTYWEHVAIQDARRNSTGYAKAPSASELARSLKTREDGERVKPPPEEREIRLSGIVYKGSADWAIWLNNKRVTPDALPSEVLDLKVYKNYVEMKWFDEYTNQILPLRLRPHQRFNIDSRIFLPG